jgi:hypothetical protein
MGHWDRRAGGFVLRGNPEAIETASGLTKISERWRQRRKCAFSLHPDESMGHCVKTLIEVIQHFDLNPV